MKLALAWIPVILFAIAVIRHQSVIYAVAAGAFLLAAIAVTLIDGEQRRKRAMRQFEAGRRDPR